MQAAAAIEDRIRQFQSDILAFVRRRSVEAPEEVAQEVWLRVHRANPDCPTDAQFRAYAYATARRVLIDHHRRRSARIQLVSLDHSIERMGDTARPDDVVSAGDVLGVVERTLTAMKPELAQVFRWRTAEDVAFREIAVRQDCSVNTALGRMHQAVKKIRAALVAEGLVPTGGRP